MQTITLFGRIRFVKERKTGTDKLTNSAALCVSCLNDEKNWVDLQSDQLLATDNGQNLATQLAEAEGQLAEVSGFWVIDGPVTENERGFLKAKYRALRVTSITPVVPEKQTELPVKEEPAPEPAKKPAARKRTTRKPAKVAA